MSAIGMRKLYWARHTSEPDSALPVLATGKILGGAMSANRTITFANAQEFTDDSLSDEINDFVSGTITGTTNYISPADEAELLGHTVNGNEVGRGADDNPPYGALGYIRVIRTRTGATVYRAFWNPKVKANLTELASNTKTGSVAFTPFPFTFTLFKPNWGKWEYFEEFATEDAADAYLRAKLNVGTYYTVDVRANGAGAGEGVDKIGTFYVASDASFPITISGTPTALYDNGVDKAEDIAAGVYTVATVTANHDIAVIF